MKKTYTIPEIIAGIINLIMPILIIYFTFTNKEIWDNRIWAITFGMWGGWFETRNYYKKKMQSNTQIKERK